MGQDRRGEADEGPELARKLSPALPGDQSLFSSETEAEVNAAQKQHDDKLLGDQLTAQLHSGLAAKPTKLKKAENRGLFEEEGPEQTTLFSRERTEWGSHGPIARQFYHDVAGAIAWLIKHQTGEAIGALHHPAVGDIDLIWEREGRPWHGDDTGYGLAHIIAKHGGEFPVESLQALLNDMRPVSPQTRRDRMELKSETYHATVRLSWNRKAKKWLLTTFDYTVPLSAKGRSIVPGVPEGTSETGPSLEGGKVPLPTERSDASGNPVSGAGEASPPDSGEPDSNIAPSEGEVNSDTEAVFNKANADADRDKPLFARKPHPDQLPLFAEPPWRVSPNLRGRAPAPSPPT